METYGKIDNLLDEIANDAEKEIKKIIEEAEKFAEDEIKKSEREVKVRERRILKEAQKKADEIRKRVLSNVNMEINRLKLKKRDEIIDEVIKRVENKIKDLINNKESEYKEYILKELKNIFNIIKEKDLIIIFNIKDKDIFDNNFLKNIINIAKTYNKNLSLKDIEFSESISKGFIIKVKNSNLIYNNEIMDKFNRLRNKYRLEIYEELFGE